jgi:hypothetical protein
MLQFMMNTLIEDATKLEYLTSNSQWTKNAADGKDFRTTADALAAAKQEPIDAFNIVGYFPINEQLINIDRGRGKGPGKTGAANG